MGQANGMTNKITIACVWNGEKYAKVYVERLRDMIRGQLRDVRMICLTDRADDVEGVDMIDLSDMGLQGWFMKLALFCPTIRGRGRCVYFDLDTVIIGNLRPLIDWNGDFGICENFTRAAGNKDWPCKYGSCVMSFREGWGSDVFREFSRDANGWIDRAGKYGDQWIIERLVPDASILQRELPPNFFIGYREFSDVVPDESSVAIFAGSHKPDNSRFDWVNDYWKASRVQS